MKNLEQVRAKNAFDFAEKNNVTGKDGGNIIKDIGPQIMNHGILATLAYACENKGYADVFDAIATHLADPDISILKRNVNGTISRIDMQKQLIEGSSDLLKLATQEAMAWLSYARRFVKKNNDEKL